MPDVTALQRGLVEELKRRKCIRTAAVEAAFRAVPRHLFLPSVPRVDVYRDVAIPTKRGADGEFVSSSSQPAIMALMLEQLALALGQHVLEIGAGTGYNAALIAHIVGPSGRIVTIDIEEDIASAGRLLLPLSIKGPQMCVAFERANAHLESVSIEDCGFMMLRGAFAAPGGMASHRGDTHSPGGSHRGRRCCRYQLADAPEPRQADGSSGESDRGLRVIEPLARYS
jgi:protein-L-isoaspartate(D-aspartate) O-methyltransferase